MIYKLCHCIPLPVFFFDSDRFEAVCVRALCGFGLRLEPRGGKSSRGCSPPERPGGLVGGGCLLALWPRGAGVRRCLAPYARRLPQGTAAGLGGRGERALRDMACQRWILWGRVSGGLDGHRVRRELFPGGLEGLSKASRQLGATMAEGDAWGLSVSPSSDDPRPSETRPSVREGSTGGDCPGLTWETGCC